MHGPVVVPPVLPFEQACRAVLDHLSSVLPLGLWAVTRRDGDRQVFLSVRDEAYGVPAGAALSWEASLCRRMTTGASPQVVPDLDADAAMAGAPARADFPIGAYVGAPIRSSEGVLFGTLCGFSQSALPRAVEAHRPLLDLLAGLLSQVLRAEALEEEAREREAELRRRASTDDLTGLATRAVFADRLEHALALHAREGTALTVLMVDLDDFKAVNDTLGHAAGDDLLVHLAREWGGRMRPGDTLARLGGDEFALLVEASTSARAVAEAVHDLPGTYAVTGTDLGVGVGVGLAHVGPQDPTPTPDEVLHRADLAMYAAKRAGKGRLVTYDDALAQVVVRLPRP